MRHAAARERRILRAQPHRDVKGGRVLQGMDVMDLIATKPTGVLNGFSDVPLEEVLVNLAVQVK